MYPNSRPSQTREVDNLNKKQGSKKTGNLAPPTSPTIRRVIKQTSTYDYPISFKPTARNVPEAYLNKGSASYELQRVKVSKPAAPRPRSVPVVIPKKVVLPSPIGSSRPPVREAAILARSKGNTLPDGTIMNMNDDDSDDSDFEEGDNEEDEQEVDFGYDSE